MVGFCGAFGRSKPLAAVICCSSASVLCLLSLSPTPQVHFPAPLLLPGILPAATELPRELPAGLAVDCSSGPWARFLPGATSLPLIKPRQGEIWPLPLLAMCCCQSRGRAGASRALAAQCSAGQKSPSILVWGALVSARSEGREKQPAQPRASHLVCSRFHLPGVPGGTEVETAEGGREMGSGALDRRKTA